MKIKCFFSTLLVILAGATGVQRASAQEPAQPLTATVAFQGSATAILPSTLGSKEMPFGFSIQCSGGRCAGALSFGPNTPQYVTGTVRALLPEMFLVSVSKARGLPSSTSMSCALVNHPPITQGQTNKVTITCAAPAFTATSDNATVIVTAARN
jgi:hypothetical protein